MSIKDDMKNLVGGKGKPSVDADAIRALSELLNETGLTEIEIEREGARIRVSRAAASAPPPAAPSVAVPAAPSVPAPPPVAAGPAAGTVPSPMVGTVYMAPEPGKPAFISVGKTVKEGDTLFIIEAMKTMNAITAPKAGTVREICVSDSQPVEFGQALCVVA
jgi:acetyl-CoA carboxylase biotin carboxyl carrier protein